MYVCRKHITFKGSKRATQTKDLLLWKDIKFEKLGIWKVSVFIMEVSVFHCNGSITDAGKPELNFECGDKT